MLRAPETLWLLDLTHTHTTHTHTNRTKVSDTSIMQAVHMGNVDHQLMHPHPFERLNIRILIVIPMKGRRFINQGFTLDLEPQYIPYNPYITHYNSFHLLFHYPYKPYIIWEVGVNAEASTPNRKQSPSVAKTPEP